MKRISRQILICACMLIFFSSACGGLGRVPATQEEAIPGDSVQVFAPASSISVQPTRLSAFPLIPVTGENVVSLQCQFCVNDETHAILTLPEYAYFDVVSSTPVRCITANIVNGRRILLCRGAQSTSFSLNICSDSTNCLQFPVVLESCSLLPGSAPLGDSTPSSAVFFTPVDPAGNQNSDPPAPGSNPTIPTLPPPVVPTDLPLPTDEPPPPTAARPQEEDIVICHTPPGNPDGKKTMTVSLSAWQNEHSRHGDSRGACE